MAWGVTIYRIWRMKLLAHSIFSILFFAYSCEISDSKIKGNSTDEANATQRQSDSINEHAKKLASQLDAFNIVEKYKSGNPKKIKFIIGDTILVQHLTEEGKVTHKLIYIGDWLYQKSLADEKGNVFLYEKFDSLQKNNKVRFRIEFSKSGDTLAYGKMKSENIYFGKWTDVSNPHYKIVTEISEKGEFPDSIRVYYKNTYLRTVSIDEIDNNNIYKLK